MTEKPEQEIIIEEFEQLWKEYIEDPKNHGRKCRDDIMKWLQPMTI